MNDARARVRPASTSDAKALAVLCGELGYPSTSAQVRDRLRLLEDEERTLLVAEAEDGVAGFIDVHVQRVVEADPYAEVGGLVVRAGHRGEGLGAALLAAAADWGRGRGLGVMWIRANLARDGVHDFYPAVGCRRVKDQRVYEYRL
jgi:GNAT superfamily N-acetyltransferase